MFGSRPDGVKIKNLSKLEKEWHGYITQTLKVTSHRGYEKAARSAIGLALRRQPLRWSR